MTEELLHSIILSASTKVRSSYIYNNEGQIDNSIHGSITNSISTMSAITRLVVPKYGDHGSNAGKPRISEQELRFAFIEALKEEEKAQGYLYSYSVETPTKNRYSFGGEIPKIEKSSKYRSGNFDVVLYDKQLKRKCLIEFKYGTDTSEFAKDFLKLGNPEEGENDSLRYFIHLIPKGNIKEYKSSLAKLRDVNKNVAFKNVTYFPIGLSGQKLKKEIIDLNTVKQE